MKICPDWKNLLLASCLALLALMSARADISIPIPSDSGPPDTDIWPRVRQEVGATYTIYQPQIENWDGVTLSGRAAVSVQEGKAEPIYGVVSLSAQASVDRDERMVSLDHINVISSHFPTLTEENPYMDVFKELIPKEVPAISLDRIESSLEAAQSNAKPKILRNAPPSIVVSDHPALLVPVDGAPHWAAVSDTGLQRLINTRALLLKDLSGFLFLHLYDGYVGSTSLNGPWAIVERVPSNVTDALESLVKAQQVDLLAGQPDPDTQRLPTLANNRVPEIHVVTAPTELIVTDGVPKWKPVPTTQLLAIENTPSHVFKYLSDQSTYVLISGRWFKAPSLSGPWVYVPGKTLPADFAAIPETSDQENVKASVPGTPEAEEAMIANDIPTTTKISRDTTMSPAPQIDGPAQLGPIEGTGIKTVINSDTPILEVTPHQWLSCQNGVWFSASSLNGPWSVATAVPPEVYSIPASSPLYYLTFVRIYRAGDEFVWLGYTAGYYGAVASDDGTVVYGTGYTYEPYLSDNMWVARPWTYGYGSTLCWTPWGGWGFGFGVGWAWGAPWDYWACCPPAPFWGPYWNYCYRFRYEPRGGPIAWGVRGWYAGVGNLYSRRGPWAGRIRVSGAPSVWDSPRSTARYGQAYNSVTGLRITGQVHTLRAVYAAPVHTEAVPVNSQATYKLTRPAPAVPRVFAGPDGRVYQREENGTWHDMAPNHPVGPANPQALDRDYRARQQGDQRSQSFRETRSAPAPQQAPSQAPASNDKRDRDR